MTSVHKILSISIIIIWFFCQPTLANVEGRIDLGSGFENNVFYNDKTDHADGFGIIDPNLGLDTETGNVHLKTITRGKYRKYFTLQKADITDYHGNLDFAVNEQGSNGFSLNGIYDKTSDPPQDKLLIRK